jgi:putative cell wall-binding protein
MRNVDRVAARRPRTLGVLALVAIVAALVVAVAPPAFARAEQATIESPMSGSVTSSPGTHHRMRNTPGDWSMDVGAGAGTPVIARFGSSRTITLHVDVVAGSCASGGGGRRVQVGVHVDGVYVGWVNYLHIEPTVAAGQWLENGAQVGTVGSGYPIDSSCWTGPHVHIEPYNDQSYSCFQSRPEGQSVSAGERLGVIGGEWAGGVNQACPDHAYGASTTVPPTTDATTTTSTSSTSSTTTTSATSTTVASLSPSLSVSPGTGDRTTQFVGSGSGFTPLSTAVLDAYGPSGSSYGSYELAVDDAGAVHWSWTWAESDEVGTYRFAAQDTSGARSTETTLTITDDSTQSPRTWTRLAGSDRYGTASTISAHLFRNGSPVVYLASGEAYPDALSAGMLRDGPILLVPRCGAVPHATAVEIDRLTAARVVAIGGTGAICDDVVDAAADGRPVDRLAGADRFGTSVEVSRRAFPTGAPVVYLASADGFADALAAGSLQDGPVLVVPSCGRAPAAVLHEIDRLDAAQVVAVGGTASVCDRILDEVAGGRPTARIAGSTRFGTAAAVAERSFPAGAATVHLARADAFPDAVAGGTLTAGPVLLVPSCGPLPDEVDASIDRLEPDEVIALGGEAAVCDAVAEDASG